MLAITKTYVSGESLSILRTVPIANAPVFPVPFFAWAINEWNGSEAIKGMDTD